MKTLKLLQRNLLYILLPTVLCVGCDRTLKLSNDVVFDLNDIELTNNKEINKHLKGKIYGKIQQPYNDLFGTENIYAGLRLMKNNRDIGSFYLNANNDKITVINFQFGDINSDEYLRDGIVLNDFICREILKQKRLNFKVTFINATTNDTTTGKEFLGTIKGLAEEKRAGNGW